MTCISSSKMTAPGFRRVSAISSLDRGQRIDTLRPGQGVGLAVVRDIVEQYDGRIVTHDSLLGGAKMEVIFSHQDLDGHEG
ncbi:Sensor protein PhoQ [Kluyvera intermedia]|nr:Sensor protein PhoQ [Kluyvera intermedia]